MAPGQVQHSALGLVRPPKGLVVPLLKLAQVPVHGQILPWCPCHAQLPVPCKHAEGELEPLPVSLGTPLKSPRAEAEP